MFLFFFSHSNTQLKLTRTARTGSAQYNCPHMSPCKDVHDKLLELSSFTCKSQYPACPPVGIQIYSCTRIVRNELVLVYFLYQDVFKFRILPRILVLFFFRSEPSKSKMRVKEAGVHLSPCNSLQKSSRASLTIRGVSETKKIPAGLLFCEGPAFLPPHVFLSLIQQLFS